MSQFQIHSPYDMQIIAIGRLMEWLRQAHRLKMDGSVRDKVITLDDSLSQRFAIGFPKKTELKAKPQPFLGIQRTERAWMHPMQWSGAYVKQNDRRIYLITKEIISSDARNPTMPSFAIGITVNDPSKLNLLFLERQTPRLEGREMWIDEGGGNHINLKKALFSVPLTLLDSRAPLPFETNQTHHIETLQDRMVQSLQNNPQNEPARKRGTFFTPGRPSPRYPG